MLVKAYIVPEMLKWARETAGMTVQMVAQKMKKETSIIEKWEHGED